MNYKEALQSTEDLYMNPKTGSVDTLDGWDCDKSELVQVECDQHGWYREV